MKKHIVTLSLLVLPIRISAHSFEKSPIPTATVEMLESKEPDAIVQGLEQTVFYDDDSAYGYIHKAIHNEDKNILLAGLLVLKDYTKTHYFAHFPDDKRLFVLCFSRDKRIRCEAAMALSNQAFSSTFRLFNDEYLRFAYNIFGWFLVKWYFVLLPILSGIAYGIYRGLRMAGIKRHLVAVPLSAVISLLSANLLTLFYIVLINSYRWNG